MYQGYSLYPVFLLNKGDDLAIETPLCTRANRNELYWHFIQDGAVL